jgi:hypothetical protein
VKTAPPDWVRDLLGLWAERDWHDAQIPLGLPTVSPMFAKGMGLVVEVEDTTGYSSVEVQAMAAGIEWLQQTHADHWRALSREIRPWTRRDLQRTDNDQQLVVEALRMLERFVDDALE